MTDAHAKPVRSCKSAPSKTPVTDAKVAALRLRYIKSELRKLQTQLSAVVSAIETGQTYYGETQLQMLRRELAYTRSLVLAALSHLE